MMTKKTIETLDPKEVIALAADLSKDNEYITETAGFIPLEVKLKQFEQNGLIAQFSVQDFDSNDYRDIYLNPDLNPTPEDDYEDIQEKLEMRKAYIEELKEKKAKSNGQNAKAGTVEPQKKAAEAANKSAANEQRDGAESVV